MQRQLKAFPHNQIFLYNVLYRKKSGPFFSCFPNLFYFLSYCIKEIYIEVYILVPFILNVCITNFFADVRNSESTY